LVAEGKFPQAEFDALDAATDLNRLPDRKGPARHQGRVADAGESRYHRAARAKHY
jgi:hypothetical protein